VVRKAKCKKCSLMGCAFTIKHFEDRGTLVEVIVNQKNDADLMQASRTFQVCIRTHVHVLVEYVNDREHDVCMASRRIKCQQNRTDERRWLQRREVKLYHVLVLSSCVEAPKILPRMPKRQHIVGGGRHRNLCLGPVTLTKR